MMSKKRCSKCGVDGFYNQDEVRCVECKRLLIPITMIPTIMLTEIEQELKRLSEAWVTTKETDTLLRRIRLIMKG